MAKERFTTTQTPVACFAPTLTDDMLDQYADLIAGVDDPETKDALDTCMKCVKHWWQLPESERKDAENWAARVPDREVTGEVKRGTKGEPLYKEATFSVVPLEEAHVKELWEDTPWLSECERFKQLFEKIDPVSQRELRNAAHHLLWHTIEISNDREPLTQDKLPA